MTTRKPLTRKARFMIAAAFLTALPLVLGAIRPAPEVTPEQLAQQEAQRAADQKRHELNRLRRLGVAWNSTVITQDPMTDQRKVMESITTISDIRRANPLELELVCDGGTTGIRFYLGGRAVPANSQYWWTLIRLDGEPAFRQPLLLTSDRESLGLDSAGAIKLMKRIAGHKVMRVEFHHGAPGAFIAAFNVEEFGQRMQNIGQACGWD